MASPVTAKFGQFQILLGSGTSPITYAAPCGFNSKDLTFGKNLSEVALPDCDDPDAVIVLGRDVQSTTASINGTGVLAADAVDTWFDAYESTSSVPVQIEIQFSIGTVIWTGNFHIESIKLAGEQGGRVTIDVSMQSDGLLVRTGTLSS